MRAGRKSTRIAAIAFLAGTVAARSPEIKYILAHGNPAEDQTRAQLQRVLKEYDLSDWIWTRTVVIDSGAIPHSHPRLTLHTRHRGDDLLLLSTFVTSNTTGTLQPTGAKLRPRSQTCGRCIRKCP